MRWFFCNLYRIAGLVCIAIGLLGRDVHARWLGGPPRGLEADRWSEFAIGAFFGAVFIGYSILVEWQDGRRQSTRGFQVLPTPPTGGTSKPVSDASRQPADTMPAGASAPSPAEGRPASTHPSGDVP